MLVIFFIEIFNYNIDFISMQILPLAFFALLIVVPIQSVYLPELQACASTTFINKQITAFGPTIEK